VTWKTIVLFRGFLLIVADRSSAGDIFFSALIRTEDNKITKPNWSKAKALAVLMSPRHMACLQISVSIVEFFGPPRIRIIPNEVTQKRNIVVAAENIAGRKRGRVILQNVLSLLAPRIRD